MSQARNGRSEWFELSEEGWRRSNRARPLGQLVREALQNAFDQRARRDTQALHVIERRASCVLRKQTTEIASTHTSHTRELGC